MNSPQILATPREITPSNLSRTIDELRAGEKLEIKKLPDGSVSMSIVMTRGDKRSYTKIESKLESFLHPLPVRPGWMSIPNESSDYVKQLRKDHRKEIRAKVKESKNGKELLKGLLKLELSFKSKESASLVKSDVSSYWMYNLRNHIVYAKDDGTPVMYRLEEGGRLFYL